MGKIIYIYIYKMQFIEKKIKAFQLKKAQKFLIFFFLKVLKSNSDLKLK